MSAASEQPRRRRRPGAWGEDFAAPAFEVRPDAEILLAEAEPARAPGQRLDQAVEVSAEPADFLPVPYTGGGAVAAGAPVAVGWPRAEVDDSEADAEALELTPILELAEEAEELHLAASVEAGPDSERILVAALEAEMTRFPGFPLATEKDNPLAQIISAASVADTGQIAALRVHLRDYSGPFKAECDRWMKAVRTGRHESWPRRRSFLPAIGAGPTSMRLMATAAVALVAAVIVQILVGATMGPSPAVLIFVLVLSAAARRLAWWMVRSLILSIGRQLEWTERPSPPFPWGRQSSSGPNAADEPYQETDRDKADLKLVQAKLKDRAFYEAVIRIVVTKTLPAGAAEDGDADEQAALERIARIIAETTSRLFGHHESGQTFAWKQADARDALLGLMPAADVEPRVVLSALEVASLIHVFDDTTVAEGVQVERSNFRPIAPRHDLLRVADLEHPTGDVLPIGVLDKGTRAERMAGMPVRSLCTHAIVLGRTGSGKSTLVEHWINASAHAGYPIFVLDPHGNLAEAAIRHLYNHAPQRVPDLVVIDPGDERTSLAYNPLDIRDESELDSAVDQGVAMLASLNFNETSQPRAIIYARQAMKALAEANLKADLSPDNRLCLLHVGRFFTDPAFRQMVVEFATSPDVLENFDLDNGAFELLASAKQQEIALPIQRVFADLESSKRISRVFASGRNKLDVPGLLAEGKIVITRLGGFGPEQRLGEMLAAMMLPAVINSAARFGLVEDPRTGEKMGRGARIFIDEAPVVLKFGENSKILAKALAECRKLDVSVTSVGQFLAQMDGNEKDLLNNTETKIVFRLSAKGTSGIEQDLAPLSSSDFAVLPKFCGYGNVALEHANSETFGFHGLPPLKSKRDNALSDRIIAQSRGVTSNAAAVIERRLEGRNLVELPMAELHAKLIERHGDDSSRIRRGEVDGGQATYDDAGGDWLAGELTPS